MGTLHVSFGENWFSQYLPQIHVIKMQYVVIFHNRKGVASQRVVKVLP